MSGQAQDSGAEPAGVILGFHVLCLNTLPV